LARLPVFSLAHLTAEARLADGPPIKTRVPPLAPGPPHHRAFGNAAEHCDRNRNRSGRAIGVSAKQRAAELRRIGTKPFGKFFQPFVRSLGGEYERQQEAGGPRALCREGRRA